MSVVGLFVDAENLVYGYLNRFRAKLDPGKLVEIANEYGTVKYYKCFGDFTNPGLKEYENRFKANTFDIISEPSVERNGKFKEFTDFNMLNHIYQTLIDDDSVTTYVLGSGDGHFSELVNRLRIRHGKTVVIVGVDGTISSKLRTAEVRTLDGSEAIAEFDYQSLIRFMQSGDSMGKILTFGSTLRVYTQAPRDEVAQALKELLKEGCLCQVVEDIEGKKVRRLRINYDHEQVKSWLRQ